MAETSSTTSITDISAMASRISSFDKAMFYLLVFQMWVSIKRIISRVSTRLGSVLFLVANRSHHTGHLTRDVVQRTRKLSYRREHHGHQ